MNLFDRCCNLVQSVLWGALLLACAPVPATRTVPTVRLAPVANFEKPLGVVSAHDGTGRLFVLEKGGTVRIVQNSTVLDLPFLDIRDRIATRWEGGLLGLAFEPNHPERFYVNYTDREGDSTIARFRVSQSYPNAALADSEEILLTVEQPEDNHNGGNLLFGPDGMLWVGLGDGGKAGDYFGNGQNPFTLLGTLLRLDVSPEQGFRVPSDNPFAGDDGAGAPAIWATGLRNPWRFSFDRATGDLWVADVGQHRWEEINHVRSEAAGLNYGWPITEGRHCYAAESCDAEGFVRPVAEYSHEEGCAVTGGYVYRGEAIPALRGHYLFGDFCMGRIWTIPADHRAGDGAPRLLLDTELAITSFGEDEAGELYVTSYDGGLFKVVPNP